MITKPIFGRLVPLALGVVVLCVSGLFNQSEVVFGGSLEPGQQQPAKVESTPADSRLLKLTPHQIVLSKTRKFNLNLPPGFEITVAAQGLKRARFMAKSPDNRIFVTDMFNRTDNQKGAVYVLDGLDAAGGKFNKVTTYLKGLRNPNSIAFYTDQNGDHWFYLALTAGGISRARSLSAAEGSTSQWAAAVTPAKKRSRSERRSSRWTWTARTKEYSPAVCATRLG